MANWYTSPLHPLRSEVYRRSYAVVGKVFAWYVEDCTEQMITSSNSVETQSLFFPFFINGCTNSVSLS